MTEVGKIRMAVRYIALHLNEYHNADELKETIFDYYYKLPDTGDGRLVKCMILDLYKLACQVMAG